ncbi:hypothetical protein RF11_04609 [Thelohanellus kitauei]|uniref:Uncharacterized protein n=1 Tax=Thelohanellus kitauei TaxID=669202 RepID=A0A0C2J1A4_THEKT|nr:hypothetical protein RF11_04609 [Thelohanellus kitauei]
MDASYNPQETSNTSCLTFNSRLVRPRRIWVSTISNSDTTSSINFLKHECEKHRGSGEQNNNFLRSVVRECIQIQGFIEKIWCRDYDGETRSVDQKVLFSSSPVENLDTTDCKPDLPFFTPFDSQIIAVRATKHTVDVGTNTVKIADPTDTGPMSD